MKRNYEIGLVFPAGKSEEEYKDLEGRVTSWITDGEGEVTNRDVWGRRRLAYQIGQHREGYYLFLYANIEPRSINELSRRLNIDDDVVRYLVIREDE